MSGAKPRNRNPITTLAPTSKPMPMACTERMNQNEKTELDSRIQILRPVSSIALKIERNTGFQLLTEVCADSRSPFSRPQEEKIGDRGENWRLVSVSLCLCGFCVCCSLKIDVSWSVIYKVAP